MLVTSTGQRRRDSCADVGVHEHLAEYATRTPEHVAIRAGDRKLTYRQLNTRSEELAVRLHAAGVTRDRAVGVLLERSAEFVLAALAVLKAGGCYVPLDPRCPGRRVDTMMHVAGLSLVITRADLRHRLGDRAAAVLLVDSSDQPEPGDGADEPAVGGLSCHPFELACALFAPGTSGTPVAVAIRHCGISRLASDPACARLDASQVMASTAQPWCDSSLLEIWGVLANGGTVALAPPGRRLTGRRLARFLRAEGATCAVLTAELFDAMTDTCLDGLAGLDQLIVTVGTMTPRSASRFLQAYPESRLVNGYGPTEATAFATSRTVTAQDARGPRIPIGRPTGGNWIEILDEDLDPVPPGVPGRLYAGGIGLARGYLRDTVRTAERFIPDPWGRGERLFATGDRAVYRADGAIDLLGPADPQPHEPQPWPTR